MFSPTSMAIDEGKGNRIFWADPKFKKVESVNPDGKSSFGNKESFNTS